MKHVIKNNILAGLVAVAGTMAALSTWAAGVIVVHPSNANSLTERDIARIFLGHKKSFPDGNKAIPLDQKAGSEIRGAFTINVLNQSEEEVRAYWMKRLFTGRGTPPNEVENTAALKNMIAENPSMIGYIDKTDVDSTVKVLKEF